MNTLWFSLAAACASLAYGAFLIWQILKKPTGDEKMQSIQKAIQEGAEAYLKRQNKTVVAVGVVAAAVIYIWLGVTMAIGFLVGAVASAAAGYIGMMVSVRANVRVAEEARSTSSGQAKDGLARAFSLAFKGGSVTGFFVVGLALLSVTLFYWFTHDVKALIGLGFGSSLISVFARLGGGIFTKGADVGADLVGKVEAGIPEDDPRNPAVIADNVGDNVGDCAGMAADLFETYAVTAIATMILGHLTFPTSPEATLIPLAIGGISIITSIIGTWFVRLGKSKNIMGAMYKGLMVASVLSVAAFYPLTNMIMSGNGSFTVLNLFYCALMGIAVTIGMFVITDYYTS